MDPYIQNFNDGYNDIEGQNPHKIPTNIFQNIKLFDNYKAELRFTFSMDNYKTESPFTFSIDGNKTESPFTFSIDGLRISNPSCPFS